ncbi:Kinesin-like protein KIF21A [Exophiala dermatitidis]
MDHHKASAPPATPEATRQVRAQSMYSAPSPDPFQKQRPQSLIGRPPPRSQSRMSQSSNHVASKASDEDTKTSVKVVVRVRPPLGPSDPGFDLIPQRFQRSMVQVNTNTSLAVESPQGRKIFIFDRVFGPDATQPDIWQYLQDGVDSFLQGYNVSILAYGQSGSGKSYTMGTSGAAEQFDPSMKGVVPRAAQYLFDHLNNGGPAHNRQNSGLKSPTRYSMTSVNQLKQNSRSSADRAWEMSVTYVEIYNEQPRDLLLPENAPFMERANVQIREDRGRIFVEGLNSVRVSSFEELIRVLNHGSAIRQTDATAINARSSRSHAVFTVNLRQTKAQGFSPTKDKRSSVTVDNLAGGDSTMIVESKLHFVDLAGSERLKNTGATGERAKEGISINAGLASLGKVIAQLSSRSAGTYVSYRDSKLTRMLQDSLGGNAITYMIACVTPAEFHLSETLNTVQYAQRARNIQSKPKIQQIDEGGDKQAIIDRLRAEIAFLRQQIRSAESTEQQSVGMPERGDRSKSRENELHHQLLDVQESYNALSQRHAKLVSELKRNAETYDQLHPVAGETAMDRLKRSQANQEMIEQVVMEYEKTIQSLEANLSTTRASLAMTESKLLERETKCAYIETMNQQLNSRVQKLMDRESNTEQYLHDLEARLDDQHSGGEKNDAIISELRKEIARIRESETNAEDYICTLEERLAEADQDMEIMQREVERLEHLVERQRSLGKLDNLIYELDHIQDDTAKGKSPKATTAKPNVETNGHPNDLQAAKETELPTPDDDEEDELAPEALGSAEQPTPEGDDMGLEKLETAMAQQETLNVTRNDESLPSPAQSKFVTEKFEAVSQELFDLRLEHESTVNELDLLSAKYQEALRTLARMQDSIDEERQGVAATGSDRVIEAPQGKSFLDETDLQEAEDGQELPSSRSLSSELSLAGESSPSIDTDITPVSKKTPSVEVASNEIERLQHLLAEHESSLHQVTEQYAQLQADHKEALTTVERLKTQVQRSRPASPGTPGMLRRMTSQIGSGVDRGQRSMTSLRTLLAEEFESKPDRMETAEVHLSAANTELQARLDRIQSLEAEVKSVKKEMELKSTIISGLTRERTSIKAGSPVDLNMVSQLRDQIIQKETELKSLHESYARREQGLQEEIQRLTSEKANVQAGPSSPEADEQVNRLNAELAELKSKLQETQEAAEESEKKYVRTKSELEAALASIATLKAQQSTGENSSSDQQATTAEAMQTERDSYQDLVNKLKQEIEEQRRAHAEHLTKSQELEQLHESLSKDYAAQADLVKSQEQEISALKTEVSQLELKVKEAEAAVEFHKHGLKSLHEAHANEIEEMKLAHSGHLAGYDDQVAEMTAKHEKLVATYKADLEEAVSTVEKLVSDAQVALGHPTSADMLVSHIQDIVEEKRHIAEANARITAANAELERQLEGRQSLVELEEELANANSKIANYQETIRSLANEVGNHEETIREKDELLKKAQAQIEAVEAEKAKKLVIIEELEQQLQNSFDQHNNRVSLIQAQGSQALIEAQQRIAVLEKDLDQRRSMNDGVSDTASASRSNTIKSQHNNNRPQSPAVDRSNSMTSNLRKSGSIASLPSPPPAIPLPPLPNLAASAAGPPSLQVSGATANPSPPQSRHASKDGVPVPVPVTPVSNISSQPVSGARQSAILEEQENRLRTIEKHLHAEKQLTATLEEALVDLETQSNKLRADAESWKKKAWAMEEELSGLRKERRSERLSVQAVEEEVKKRREAEAARAQLEERMRLLTVGKDGKKKKKGSSLNCF